MRSQGPALCMRAIDSFTGSMRAMRTQIALATRSNYGREQQFLHVTAFGVYAEAVERLGNDLDQLDLGSQGLDAFRTYIARYAGSDEFAAVATEAQALATALAEIRYYALIRDRCVVVSHFGDEVDFTPVVPETR